MAGVDPDWPGAELDCPAELLELAPEEEEEDDDDDDDDDDAEPLL